MKPFRLSAILVLALLLGACGAATQNIPVSSNPDGADVLADGQPVGTTPCNVTLEKTQPHILTLKKDGYRQVDVQITRKYDTATVARNATNAGMWSSSNGANTDGAVANALMNVSADEQSGNAYVLSPASVVVTLRPVNQVAQAAGGQGQIVISPDQLDPADRARFENAEKADVQTTEPATLGDAVRDDPAGALEDAAKAAAVAAPTVGTKKEWKSSKSSESLGNGSYSKTTTSTKASVGVSVNPVEAGLGVLDLLKNAEQPAGQDSGQASDQGGDSAQ
ncbi:PEGA domain-containing protein [Pseudodesulfovibrio sp.]|uniref:PEGA domain-containing protein n=1 Tax=Pseudodesulfovibrio sp. TaxID=2035812 RepID=UPI00263514D6|nr:PEGA domain-containing protein [Pseudodesulfovibrio sp.]MDD3313672.1 PEGA domain-containing protein [Pseudodesulfovibrio sp.]